MSSSKKRKLWNEESISHALDLVNEGLSVNRAAKATGIPESALRRRINLGKPKRTGHKTTLDSKEENELVKYICFMSNIGHPVTPKWIMQTAGRFKQVIIYNLLIYIALIKQCH